MSHPLRIEFSRPSTIPQDRAMLASSSLTMMATADIFSPSRHPVSYWLAFFSRGLGSRSHNSLPIEALAFQRGCRREKSFVGYSFERLFFAKRSTMFPSRYREFFLLLGCNIEKLKALSTLSPVFDMTSHGTTVQAIIEKK